MGQIRDVIVLQTERLHVVADSNRLWDGANSVEARVEVMKILQRAELLGQVLERVVRHDESLEGRQRQHLRGQLADSIARKIKRDEKRKIAKCFGER